MIGEFSVEAPSRWDAVTLLRALGKHHAWTVQLGEDRWVVAGRADTDAAGDEVEAIVAQWATDRGRPDLVKTLVNEVSLLRSPERLQ